MIENKKKYLVLFYTKIYHLLRAGKIEPNSFVKKVSTDEARYFLYYLTRLEQEKSSNKWAEIKRRQKNNLGHFM